MEKDYLKIEKSAKRDRTIRNIFIYTMLIFWSFLVLFPFY